MMRFEGKKAVVVGGCGAIGSAIAAAIAAEGGTVALADRTIADAAVESVRAAGSEPLAFEVDITRSDAVNDLMRDAENGLGAIDVLVNAAGVTSLGSAMGLTEQEWDRVLSINLKGVFLCCQAVVPAMRRRGSGRIVNIGSLLAKNGGNPRPWIDPQEQNGAANAAYGAAKAGVHALTFYLARELAAQRITVNAVAPGPIETAMTRNFPDRLRSLIPLGRMGKPSEVAAAVLFLACDAASYITGEIIDVNGGAWAD